MKPTLRTWGWGIVLAVLQGCTQPFGHLESVLVDAQPEARPVEAGESARVEIIREGREEQGQPNMPLRKGDALVTAADGVGIMLLGDSYRIIMDPGTDLTIENPSIFVRVGRIIVKKIREVREALTVKTELGAAAVEGTEFVLEVNRRQEVQLTVLEGRVKFYQKPRAISDTTAVSYRRRDTLTYVAGERARLDAATMVRLPTLPARTVDSLRGRIRHLEITAHPAVPDVVGIAEAEARAELERHGLVPSVVPVITRQSRRISRGERASSFADAPKVGTVVSTSPAAGTRIRQGARVRLNVEEHSIMVPDVMRQPYTGAERMLNAAGLKVGDTTYQVVPNAPEGTVTGMAPGPGVFVRPGTAVALTLVRARAGEARDSVRGRRAGDLIRATERVTICSVPDLLNLTEDQAIAALENARVKAGEVSRQEGRTVIAQEPKAGTVVRCGTRISFTLGAPPEIIR